MKIRILIALTVALYVFSTAPIQAQESSPEQNVRPRTVTHPTVNPPAINPNVPVPGGAPAAAAPEMQKTVTTAPLTYLTPSMIQSRIGEAQRFLKTRPRATAMTTPSIEFVIIAALDRDTARTHLITVSKQTFLTKGA